MSQVTNKPTPRSAPATAQVPAEKPTTESALLQPPAPPAPPAPKSWVSAKVGTFEHALDGFTSGLAQAAKTTLEAVHSLRGEVVHGVRPTHTLKRFDVAKYWDADSTPPALAALSRAVGSMAPKSGARTPEVEAGIVLASLMHDVAYYYGGDVEQKAAADALFGKQIPYFASKLSHDPKVASAAQMAAAVDVSAVTLGGLPSAESYAWSYGLKPSQRGFAPLQPGEAQAISKVARETFESVVKQIADGDFKLSGVLAGKLAGLDPVYREQLTSSVVTLAKRLEADRRAGRTHEIPGF